MIERRRNSVSIALLAALVACRSSQPTTDAVEASSEPAEPVGVAEPDLEPSTPPPEGDTFAYLAWRYDGNGDGTITSEEYTRHEVQLSRWDTDGDGVLTETDFDVPEPSFDEIGELRKRRVVGRYFQADDEHEVLRIEELDVAFAVYEGEGGDGELTASEFSSQAQARVVALPGDDSLMMQNYTFGDPWQTLLRGFDSDATGTIAVWELGEYVEGHGRDGLRYDLDRCDGGAPGDTFERVDMVAGLAEGSDVPDLEIARLGGDGTVALTELAGEIPVALIFGSYT